MTTVPSSPRPRRRRYLLMIAVATVAALAAAAALVVRSLPEDRTAAPQRVSSPTTGPHVDWIRYEDPRQRYALRYPPDWFKRACETNLWLAPTPDMLPGCEATDFFAYVVWVRVDEGAEPPATPLDEASFDDIETAEITVGGVTGKRHSGIVSAEDELGPAVGTAVVQYLFVANQRLYTISYEDDPKLPAAAETRRKFDLMVTETLDFDPR